MTSTIPRGLYVAGIWAETAGVRQIVCPADLTPVGAVAECTSDDAAAAVLAARSAFDEGSWSALPQRERGDLLLGIADRLQRDLAVYAKAEALDTGKPLAEARRDVVDVIACFRRYGEIPSADAPGREAADTSARTVSIADPVGVCALITSSRYP